MKIAEKCKVIVAGAIVAALMAGTALPALAVSPAGGVPFAVLAQQNSTVTPEQVEALISQIAPVTLESETAINNAQAAFNSMPTEWQSMVSNYDKLKLYQEELEDLQVDALAEKLNNTVYREHDDVENVDFFFWKDYPKLNQTNFILPYFCVVDNNVQPLRLMYTYYAKNWIFWDEIVYSVDGEVYKKEIDRAKKSEKVVKEIFSGDVYVWELGDDIADEQEISMLKKSISAEKVTYRFKGDNAQFDYKMSTYVNDRNAISQIMEAYDCMSAASPAVRARALEKVEAHKQGSKFIKFAY